MQSSTLDTKEATNAFFAARDARMRNYAMGSTYSAAEKLRAERMKLGLELAYNSDEIHINYRGKFIAVKMSNASVRDRNTMNKLESMYAIEGVVKRISKQGTIYRIPRLA